MRSPFMSILAHFLRSESGATSIEYCLIAAGISLAIVSVVQGVGTSLATTYSSIQTALR
jgi:pilus assembly protein Flp/PilA